MPKSLRKRVHRIDNLEAAWRVILANGRASTSDIVRAEIDAFAEASSSNLRSLQRRLSKRAYQFPKARGILLPKRDGKGNKTGKDRPIVLATVEARVVQRALLNVLVEVPALEPFIRTPYSFGGLRKVDRGNPDGLSKIDKVSAVPGAIKAVLDSIGDGSKYVACADIEKFFTRVSKDRLLSILSSVVDEQDFIDFVESAIRVELANMDALKGRAMEFPIHEIGVAQGSSLSPLLGNIILADFDKQMNEGDCRCIRYIDDFIILAPTEKAANARLRKAKKVLAALGMDLSPEKSAQAGTHIKEGFEFLGIEISPGWIRPGQKARAKFLASLDAFVVDANSGFRRLAAGQTLPHPDGLISVLRRLDGKVSGWSKHYWFCNDHQLMSRLDQSVSERVRRLLGSYRTAREGLSAERWAQLLGLTQLAAASDQPFEYPSAKA